MTRATESGEKRKRLSMKRWVLTFALLLGLPPVGLGVTMIVVVRHRIAEYHQAQSEPAAYVEIDPDQVRAGKAVAIIDKPTVDAILSPMKGVSYFLPNHPRKQEKYYLDVHRANGRVDEYEVFLDRRGPEYDHIHVVQREGNRVSYGSAFKIPGIRGPLLAAFENARRSTK